MRDKETPSDDARRSSQHGTTSKKTLLDIGVSKKQSSAWQKLASVSEDEFEAILTDPESKLTNEKRFASALGISRLKLEPSDCPD